MFDEEAKRMYANAQYEGASNGRSELGLQNAISQRPNAHKSMECIDKAIESLWNRVIFLQDRLEPVVLPSEPYTTDQKDAEKEGCPLVSRLDECSRNIYDIESLVNSILDRLQL